MNGSRILGTGSYTPDNVVYNKDLENIVDTSDTWIRERTGISERRISSGENTSQIAAKAAIKALENSQLEGDDIDLILVATITPDSLTPSVACNVQKYIGASNAMAFDISAACSGFIFALDIANNYLSTGRAKNALIIGAEVLSKIIDWKDRSTCVLFGDGAGAVVLGKDSNEHISYVNCKSIGSKGDSLTCSTLPLDSPFAKDAIEQNNKLQMNGKDVYKFAVRIMGEEFNRIIKESNISKNEIDFILPHQANIRMIESFSKKVDIPLSNFIINLDSKGNTSGASIPIALDEANLQGKLTNGDNIIVVGFGGGLTYGSALIKWNQH